VRRQLRISGADTLEPHDHVAWYGSGTADLYALASQALAAGARRGEKLLFIAEDPDPARLELDDLDRLLARGRLQVLPVESVYGTSSSFSPRRQLAIFEAVLADAMADGYPGISLVADNTPFVLGGEGGFRRWLRWEQLTDRFASNSNVIGICYFDRDLLSDERQSDLASLHPVCAANGAEPPFSLFADGEAISATGTLDLWSAAQFRRVLETTPDDGPLVVELSGADFVDHQALLALNAVASATRPVRIRGARPIVRKLVSLLELPTPHLRFE
jgi:anti-anti-sigma regulatory factor